MGGEPDLSPEQLRVLEDAGRRARTFLGAARVATINGWSIGIFAVLTILFGFLDPVALLLGFGMAAVARNELRGRALLRRMDPAGPRLLGRNQLGFMAMILLYCVWSLYRAIWDPSPELRQAEELLDLEGDLVRDLAVATWVGVIAATVVFQGLNARYYFKRVPMVEGYVAATPEWVVKLQRSAALD
jgi:hypothetical protein